MISNKRLAVLLASGAAAVGGVVAVRAIGFGPGPSTGNKPRRELLPEERPVAAPFRCRVPGIRNQVPESSHIGGGGGCMGGECPTNTTYLIGGKFDVLGGECWNDEGERLVPGSLRGPGCDGFMDLGVDGHRLVGHRRSGSEDVICEKEQLEDATFWIERLIDTTKQLAIRYELRIQDVNAAHVGTASFPSYKIKLTGKYRWTEDGKSFLDPDGVKPPSDPGIKIWKLGRANICERADQWLASWAVTPPDVGYDVVISDGEDPAHRAPVRPDFSEVDLRAADYRVITELAVDYFDLAAIFGSALDTANQYMLPVAGDIYRVEPGHPIERESAPGRFYLACSSGALAKARLMLDRWGDEPAEDHGPLTEEFDGIERPHAIKRRMATLHMLTGRYCDQSETEPGVPLYIVETKVRGESVPSNLDNPGTVEANGREVAPDAVDAVEARWNERGATCISDLRLDGGDLEDIRNRCGDLPPCPDNPGNTAGYWTTFTVDLPQN